MGSPHTNIYLYIKFSGSHCGHCSDLCVFCDMVFSCRFEV